MPEGTKYENGYPSGHADPETHAVLEVLSSWFRALEDGSAHYRLPDPGYRRPPGKPEWTEEHLERFIKALDADIDSEAAGTPGQRMGATAGPGFHRLAYPQRLALAQQLEAILTPAPRTGGE